MNAYIYILSSQQNGTLYIGVTSNIIRRVYEHKNDFNEGFTSQHKVHTLVYFELYNDMLTAIEREKQLKSWKRAWKIALIEKENCDGCDLYHALL